jgi:hypothetical protein
VRGGELVPGYTSRAAVFEKAVGVDASYSIYSGASHAELYAVMQGWRDASPPHPPGTLLERRPDREAGRELPNQHVPWGEKQHVSGGDKFLGRNRYHAALASTGRHPHQCG